MLVRFRDLLSDYADASEAILFGVDISAEEVREKMDEYPKTSVHTAGYEVEKHLNKVVENLINE